MTGRLRRILLLLLALIVLGAIGYALYALRGLEGLPLIGGRGEKPVVIETPLPTTEPTEEPAEEPALEPTPAATEDPQVEPTDAPVPVQEDEDVISSLSGALRTAAGELRYRTEILNPNQSGEETDSVSLGHVYTNLGQLRVRLFSADGSLYQEPFTVDYASENLYQEARAVDLNGDGSDELVIRLHTYEGEHAVLLYVFNSETALYERVGFVQNDVITWSSDFDAAFNELWYRHGTVSLNYDCYELQGTELVMVRRLTDNRQNSAEERFSEYTVDGSRFLTVQENVPASAIDHAKWSFVNYN